MTRHPSSERFHEVLKSLGDLHDRKQADYGLPTDPFANIRASSDWGMAPYVGALLRLSDKVKRLQSFVKNGKLSNESAEDSLLDIAVYAIIAKVLLEEQDGRQDISTTKPTPKPGGVVHVQDMAKFKALLRQGRNYIDAAEAAGPDGFSAPEPEYP
jgi:hypothetical protein